MPAIIQIELPLETVVQIEELARQQQRSVNEIVRAMILQELPGLPPLPDEIETELAAFTWLSDDVLRILANSTLTVAQQATLQRLNETAQQRNLSEVEQEQQRILLDAYHRALVRRAQAALVLKERGHDPADFLDSPPT